MLRLVGIRCMSPMEQSPLPYHTDPSSLPPSDAARLDKVKLNKERWVWLVSNEGGANNDELQIDAPFDQWK